MNLIIYFKLYFTLMYIFKLKIIYIEYIAPMLIKIIFINFLKKYPEQNPVYIINYQ
jgi:hypothetical protein